MSTGPTREAAESQPKGGELFIVDNSVSGWTGVRYLHDWTDVAKTFDIATGFFEIGALLELDGKWQQLEKVRILMGSEVTHRTKAAFLKATKDRAEAILDESLEDEKEGSPFLRGVPAILEALRSRQIECRVYLKDKFHAKAYITHAKLEVRTPVRGPDASRGSRRSAETLSHMDPWLQLPRQDGEAREARQHEVRLRLGVAVGVKTHDRV
jgi:hypothetical protein